MAARLVKTVAITKVGANTGKNGYLRGENRGVRFPNSLSRALVARGYNECEVYVTDEGILLKPVKVEKTSENLSVVDLPRW